MTGGYLSKDGTTIKVVRCFAHPDQAQPKQIVGMPPFWVQVGGIWRRLDLYCDRVRHVFAVALECTKDFTEVEFLELIHDCLDINQGE